MQLQEHLDEGINHTASVDASVKAQEYTYPNQACIEHVRIEEVLGKNALETTQLVYVTYHSSKNSEKDANGKLCELGPFVRKLVNKELGLGSAYAKIYAAQKQGVVCPWVPWIYGYQEQQAQIEIYLEYLRGQTLAQAAQTCCTLDERLAFATQYFPELCTAVDALHTSFDEPIIHRDLKPSNVMICAGGVRLLDLGIARIYKPQLQSDTKHFGTRPYAPPEQYGFGQTTVKSDVYALGKILFFCVTGQEANANWESSLRESKEIPQTLKNVILHATQLDPAARPASAAALRDEAQDALRQSKTALVQGKTVLAHKESFASTAAQNQAHSRSRLSLALGTAWDILLFACGFIVFAGASYSLISPSQPVLNYPLWYLAYSYFAWIVPSVFCILFLLSDKAPLYQRVCSKHWAAGLTKLCAKSFGCQLLWALKALGILFALWMVVSILTNAW